MSGPTSTPFAGIVVAAGSGSRFGADRPKALLELNGRALVHHAARTMIAAGCAELVVVAPPGWQSECAVALSDLPITALVAGGPERTHSVRNGLAEIVALDQVPPIVLITDAARPLVPTGVIDRVVAAVAAGAVAVVPAVPVTDTVRLLGEEGTADSTMLDRSRLRAVQTPQGFDTAALTEAYAQLGDAVITDDAGVCERVGHRVRIIDGATESFKITYPADLAMAELTLSTERGSAHGSNPAERDSGAAPGQARSVDPGEETT